MQNYNLDKSSTELTECPAQEVEEVEEVEKVEKVCKEENIQFSSLRYENANCLENDCSKKDEQEKVQTGKIGQTEKNAQNSQDCNFLTSEVGEHNSILEGRNTEKEENPSYIPSCEEVAKINKEPVILIDKTERCLVVEWYENDVRREQRISYKKYGNDKAKLRAKELIEKLKSGITFEQLYPDKGPPVVRVYENIGAYHVSLIRDRIEREWRVEWIDNGIPMNARWSCKKVGNDEAQKRAEAFAQSMIKGVFNPILLHKATGTRFSRLDRTVVKINVYMKKNTKRRNKVKNAIKGEKKDVILKEKGIRQGLRRNRINNNIMNTETVTGAIATSNRTNIINNISNCVSDNGIIVGGTQIVHTHVSSAYDVENMSNLSGACNNISLLQSNENFVLNNYDINLNHDHILGKKKNYSARCKSTKTWKNKNIYRGCKMVMNKREICKADSSDMINATGEVSNLKEDMHIYHPFTLANNQLSNDAAKCCSSSVPLSENKSILNNKNVHVESTIHNNGGYYMPSTSFENFFVNNSLEGNDYSAEYSYSTKGNNPSEYVRYTRDQNMDHIVDSNMHSNIQDFHYMGEENFGGDYTNSNEFVKNILNNVGNNCNAMNSAGNNCNDMNSAGNNCNDMNSAGDNCNDMNSAGDNCNDMNSAGNNCNDLNNINSSNFKSKNYYPFNNTNPYLINHNNSVGSVSNSNYLQNNFSYNNIEMNNNNGEIQKKKRVYKEKGCTLRKYKKNIMEDNNLTPLNVPKKGGRKKEYKYEKKLTCLNSKVQDKDTKRERGANRIYKNNDSIDDGHMFNYSMYCKVNLRKNKRGLQKEVGYTILRYKADQCVKNYERKKHNCVTNDLLTSKMINVERIDMDQTVQNYQEEQNGGVTNGYNEGTYKQGKDVDKYTKQYPEQCMEQYADQLNSRKREEKHCKLNKLSEKVYSLDAVNNKCNPVFNHINGTRASYSMFDSCVDKMGAMYTACNPCTMNDVNNAHMLVHSNCANLSSNNRGANISNGSIINDIGINGSGIGIDGASYCKNKEGSNTYNNENERNERLMNLRSTRSRNKAAKSDNTNVITNSITNGITNGSVNDNVNNQYKQENNSTNLMQNSMVEFVENPRGYRVPYQYRSQNYYEYFEVPLNSNKCFEMEQRYYANLFSLHILAVGWNVNKNDKIENYMHALSDPSFQNIPMKNSFCNSVNSPPFDISLYNDKVNCNLVDGKEGVNPNVLENNSPYFSSNCKNVFNNYSNSNDSNSNDSNSNDSNSNDSN
ncbi:transcription factor with AP2 domain(s), putative (SIP2), partial [Plasmodium malariae]